ncbi:hypothetical protein RJ45_21840 [Photobacterium gaetbulicola]|uniref:Glycosyltransferase 2-like domain-containing protein n=1 Tax=Photobacterium gaetbulicola TaxID=1295392 RepID=A0A0B9FYD1_9GAMM|nr:glycosyltransferase family 2 protein [Photobacterium gaetbulicola]KHT61563.1 hypothetical protein RJ45_21840 [Photobacterium gaetbulicola]
MKVKYSVIIPVYNVINELEDCINSIYAQNFQDFEIIAVDDNSNDGSTLLLKKLSSHYGFKAIFLDENHGPGIARNKGVELAEGEYIIFVDGDDKLEQTLLSKLSTYSSELIIFDFSRFWTDATVQENKNSDILRSLANKKLVNLKDKSNVFSNFQVCWNKAYLRDYYFRENLTFDSGYYEDISFNYWSIVSAGSIEILPEVGYWYRQRAGSILNSCSDRHVAIIDQYEKVYKYFSDINCTNDEYHQLKKVLDEIFICHIFNLVVRQSSRVTYSGKKAILEGFLRLLLKYEINNKSTVSIWIKSKILKTKYKILG